MRAARRRASASPPPARGSRCGASCASETRAVLRFSAVPCTRSCLAAAPARPASLAVLAPPCCSSSASGSAAHPDAPARTGRATGWSSDDQAQVYQEAARHHRATTTTARSSAGTLLEHLARRAPSSSLNDRFSNYFDPKAYQELPSSPRAARSPGVGLSVQEDPKGLQVAERLRELAGQARRPAARRPDRRGQRPLARRQALRPTRRADPGPAGHRRHAHGRRAASGASQQRAQARDGRRAGRRLAAARRSTGVKLGRRRAVELHLGRPRRAARTRSTGAQAGRQGDRARPARQRRRPARRGGARRLASSSPTGTIVSTKGRSRPRRVFNATGGAISAQDPGRRAGRPGHGLGVGDRHRRAAGPPARDRSSARARSARASSRRSRSSPTAARSTSRSASTSCPAGATSAAAASSRAPASSPTSQAKDDPKTAPGRGARRRAEHARRASAR